MPVDSRGFSRSSGCTAPVFQVVCRWHSATPRILATFQTIGRIVEFRLRIFLCHLLQVFEVISAGDVDLFDTFDDIKGFRLHFSEDTQALFCRRGIPPVDSTGGSLRQVPRVFPLASVDQPANSGNLFLRKKSTHSSTSTVLDEITVTYFQ